MKSGLICAVLLCLCLAGCSNRNISVSGATNNRESAVMLQTDLSSLASFIFFPKERKKNLKREISGD